MKSNLKKILSMVLVLVISAVSLSLTAGAATYDITIAATDLDVARAEGQGKGYYETTPNTHDDPEYAPLDVVSKTGSTKGQLLVEPDEWVKYRVNATEAGVYSVSMKYMTSFATSVTVRNNASYVFAALPKKFVTGTLEDFGYLYLREGENDIYVDNKGDKRFNLATLYLTMVAEPDYKELKLYMPATDCNESENFTVDYADGYNKIDASGETVTFPIRIFEPGKYKVTARGKASEAGSISVTVDSVTRTATVEAADDGYPEVEVGILTLEEDEYTLTFSATNAYQLVNLAVEYVAPYKTILTSETLADGDVVARGTDKFEFTLNDNFKEVKAENVKLETEGGSIDIELKVDGKTLTVYLLETLDYGTPYTLTLTGIMGENDDTALEDIIISFTTVVEADDEGKASFADYSADNDYEDVTVKGTVLSGAGKGIAGRTVVVKNSEGVEVATAVSGANGAFEINFTIDEGTEAGDYIYTLVTDYATDVPVTVNYVSKTEEAERLGEFETAATANAVKDIFDNYSSSFGITTYADDMDALKEDDLFYNHFINKTFTNTTELGVYYDQKIVLEKLNQHRAPEGSDKIRDDVIAMITDEATCNTIGLNHNRINIIIKSSEKNNFATEFIKQPICNSEEDFMESFGALLDKYIRAACKKENIAFVLPTETTKAYTGQGIVVPVELVSSKASSTPDEDVVGIELIVTATNDEIPATVEYEGEGTAKITIEEGTATVAITFAEPTTAKSFGELTLTSPVIGGYTVTLKGTATYQIPDSEETIDAEITEGTYDILISSAPSGNKRPSGVGGGGGSKPSVNKPVEDTETPVETQKGYFDDIEDAKWAETMINSLTDKGILSASEERKFRPNDNITREEYVKMIVMVIGSHDENAKANFGDVADGHWANSYLATAANLGIVKGDANNNFGLGQNITRQDMAVIIYRVFEMLKINIDADDVSFGDSAEIAGYAKDAVNALAKLGVINGMGDNTFAPKANATRAQAAKVIYTMMEVLGI